MLTVQELHKLLKELEQAVILHSGLRHVPTIKPHFIFDEHGWSVRIPVKGPRAKIPTLIRGHGDTPEEAVQDILASLDSWAEVLKPRAK